jgi:serine/threonine protein kinase
MPKQKQATVRNQIKRELDLMKPFRHENVLRYFGMFYSKISQEINLVMEMVDGVSVTDIVVCQKKLPEKVAAFILHQALKGLVFLHENFIIHRDLKPDNMLIDANGVIKLIDFGCSAKVHATLFILSPHDTCSLCFVTH